MNWPAAAAGAALGVALIASHGLTQAAPVIEKVEPPNWWTRSTINPVRLLIRGQNLGGARFQCGRLTCSGVRVNRAGTYAFVDVTIPATLTRGSYPLTVRTDGGSATVPFSVSPPLSPVGNFRGFGADDVLYLLMPDRFANGDTANDNPGMSQGLLDRNKPRYYHGGDLAGVRAKLPYLRALGITAIWMNPVYDNNNALNHREMYDGQPITDYHGYGAVDFYAIDEHFGTMADLARLTAEAHELGIKIIADMVANHTGPYHPWVSNPPKDTWYHGTAENHLANTWQTWTLADPYSPPAMRQETLDGWFINILPDLNQDDPDVARYIIQNTLWWIGMTGMDGIRQDTWPYVPRTFWREWMTAIRREYPNVKVVGEVFDGDPTMIAFFEGGRTQFDGIDDKVDMLFDFPLYFPLRRAFAEGKQLREVAQMLARDRLYRNPNALVTFLGLHDVARFMNEPGATVDGLKLAYTFLLTTRGIPLIYYGDEIALPGGNDPDNRRDFPGGWPNDSRNAFDAPGRTAMEQSLWQHLQTLIRIRKERIDLRRAPMQHLHAGEQTFVYRRGSTVVAINNDVQPAVVRIPALPSTTDVLGICAPAQRSGDSFSITIPARSGCVF